MDCGDLLKFVKAAVEDEQKVVTYKWLSLMRNIPMNRAKMALQEFVKMERRSGLNVYLCLIGYKNCVEQKTICVKIIKEEDKESALKDFVGATCHVYGVQRTNSDASLLYSCDYDISKKLNMDNKNLLGISCDHVVVKSRKKVVELASTIATQQAVTEKKPAPSFGVSKKPTVASFFSKQKLPDNSDSGFNESKSSSEALKSDVASHSKIHNKTKGNQACQGENFSNGDKIAEPESKQAETRAPSKTTKLPVKKKSTSSKSHLIQKGKRKRVVESSESDDDSSEECNQSMDMFESTPPRTQLVSKPTSDEKSQGDPDALATHRDNQDMKENQSLNCGTNMTKVTAVKTYLDSDEEGFMITERVLEVVQVPNPGKENPPDIKMEKMKLTEAKPEVTKKLPASKKKQPANMANQSTIKSFFMKK